MNGTLLTDYDSGPNKTTNYHNNNLALTVHRLLCSLFGLDPALSKRFDTALGGSNDIQNNTTMFGGSTDYSALYFNNDRI